MKKCGIYIIKNDVNDLVYIGQSVDIMCRWYAHKQAAKNSNDQSHNTKIHKAMNDIGLEHFYVEIIEECPYYSLSEREIYWISYYNSYYKGYNMTLGGESNKGETNGRALLTQDVVEDIRMAYNSHIPFREVYEKYKTQISKRSLQKVWHGEIWQFIMPEVYNEENLQWHRTVACGFKQNDKNNQERQLTEEKISKIKELRSSGLSYEKIANQIGCSKASARKYSLYERNENPNSGIQIINIETGLVFSSYTKAAQWAKCDRHTISKYINTDNSAGVVPTTNEKAHWKTL